jgi:CRP-like cAMP-binding protein
MPVASLRAACASSHSLRDLLGRYLQFAIGQMMQTGSCNALHTAHERACRWILQAHDRVGKDEFLLTQEFLGMMLGTRRQTVALVAGQLQSAGFLDRDGLQDGACECYETLRQQYDALLA